MKDVLRITVLEDDDNDVELVRRCLSQEIPQTLRSTDYVQFRSQNTQAREWRLHPEKRKNDAHVCPASALFSSHRPRTEWKEKSFAYQPGRFTPVSQCALDHRTTPD